MMEASIPEISVSGISINRLSDDLHDLLSQRYFIDLEKKDESSLINSTSIYGHPDNTHDTNTDMDIESDNSDNDSSSDSDNDGANTATKSNETYPRSGYANSSTHTLRKMHDAYTGMMTTESTGSDIISNCIHHLEPFAPCKIPSYVHWRNLLSSKSYNMELDSVSEIEISFIAYHLTILVQCRHDENYHITNSYICFFIDKYYKHIQPIIRLICAASLVIDSWSTDIQVTMTDIVYDVLHRNYNEICYHLLTSDLCRLLFADLTGSDRNICKTALHNNSRSDLFINLFYSRCRTT